MTPGRSAKREALAEYIQQAVEQRRRLDLSHLEAASGLPKDFKGTRAFRDIMDVIALGKRINANLVLITGQNGGGKTTALKVYGSVVPEAVYWEARAGYEPKHVLKDILASLPVSSGEGWRLQTSAAITYLQDHPHVFLLDEAQRLNYPSLDLLKYIADNSGSMFVLSASNSLATRIDKWPDIASRCPVRIEVRPIELEEFVELWQADGWSLDALEAIHRLSKGIMRSIRAIFLVLDDYLQSVPAEKGAKAPRSTIGAVHVEAIAAGIVTGTETLVIARRP